MLSPACIKPSNGQRHISHDLDSAAAKLSPAGVFKSSWPAPPMIARAVAHAGDSIMLSPVHAKLTRANSSPAVLTQKSDALTTTAMTADQSTKKTKPSWGDTLKAMYGSFGRQSVAAFTATAIEHIVLANVAALNPINSVVTGLGAAAGAVSGAYTGFGLGSNMAAQYTNNRPLQYLGAGMGGLAGAALGTAPSLVEHVLYPGSNVQAYKQIGTLADVAVHAIVQHSVAKKGENIVWNSAPTVSGLTSTGVAPSILVNGAIGALKSQLPKVIASTLAGPIGFGAGGAGAAGNLARSFRSDTSIKQASSKPEALQVTNSAMTRGAFSTVVQGISMGIDASGIAGAASPAVAGIIKGMPALAYEYTPLIASRTLEGVGGILRRNVGDMTPDVTTMRARNEWIRQAVASNESNGIELTAFKETNPA